MSTANKHSLTSEVLTPLVGFCVFLCLFLWQFQSHQALWLRRIFLYFGGLIAVVALVNLRKQVKLPKQALIVLFLLVIFSSASLLVSKSLTWSLIGQPITHPSLFSLYSSIAIGLLFALSINKQAIYKLFYIVLTIFTLLNLFYWLIHGTNSRLGFLGIQLNYTAYLMVIGLIIGVWLYSVRKILPVNFIYFAQLILLSGALLTQSRVAILLSLIVTGYFIYLLIQGDQKTASTAAIIILLLFLGITVNSNHFNRVHNQQYLDTSFTYRADLVKAAIPINRSKLIMGGGVGSIERNIGNNGRNYIPINKDLVDGWKYESSHNYLIDVLVERGVVVLACFVYLVAYALYRGMHAQNKELNLLVYLLIATLFFWLFNNINIQAEVIMWGCILGLLATESHKRLSTS